MSKRDDRKKVPKRPDIDSLELAILGYVSHSQEKRKNVAEIIQGLRQVSTSSGREWINWSLTNDRLGYRKMANLEAVGYVESDNPGICDSMKGRKLITDLKLVGTIVADPLDPSFNLRENFGLYYVPSLGHPALAFDGTLLGTSRRMHDNVQETGSIQGRCAGETNSISF
jgi:hypothetical protein